jgi:transcriptional regulator with XRE-family HTH domain
MCAYNNLDKPDKIQPQNPERLLPDSRQRMRIVNQTVQSRLRQAVDKLGWSDCEVAKYSGQPQSTVYRLLNAKTANPPFGLVYEVCQALGMPLPFCDCKEKLTAPIKLYIGLSDKEQITYKKQSKKIKHIRILPELRGLIVGKIMDDCANRRYPKGSLLFISDEHRNLDSLKPKDNVIMRVRDTKKKNSFVIPMVIVPSPDCDQWIVHHITDSKNKQLVCSVDKKTLCGYLEGRKIQIIGSIQKALI